MKVRNAHSGSFRLPGGQVLAPGEVGAAPESFRASPLVARGVFEIVDDPVATKPQRSGRGGK